MAFGAYLTLRSFTLCCRRTVTRGHCSAVAYSRCFSSSGISQRYKTMAGWQINILPQTSTEDPENTLSLSGFNIARLTSWRTSSLMFLGSLCMLIESEPCREIIGVLPSYRSVIHLQCSSGWFVLVVEDIGSRPSKMCTWSIRYQKNWRLKFKKYYIDSFANNDVGL